MEYYVDIAADVFEKIKAHGTTEIVFGEEELKNLTGREGSPFFEKGDTLKLYPLSEPGADPEALRILITGEQICLPEKDEEEEFRQGGQSAVCREKFTLSFELLEWIFAMETELDDLLREEQEMLKWYGIEGE